jgi:uncharacterized delta-60 repeat protein
MTQYFTSDDGLSTGGNRHQGKRNKTDRRRSRIAAALAPLFKRRRPMFERLEDRTMLSVAGDLDQNFGVGGLRTTNFASNANDEAYSVALQSGGNYVVAGATNNQTAFGLSRYSSSGTLLSSAEVSITGPGQAQSVAVLPGSAGIITAGYSFSATNNLNFTLVKFTAAGAVDTSFGTSGVVTTAVSSRADQAFAVAVQPDNSDPNGYKLLVAGGNFITATREEFVLARYSSSGVLDSGFGTGGIVHTPIGTTGSGEIHALAINGSTIYAAGQAQNTSGNYDFALASYTLTGSLSSLTLTNFSGSSDDRANAMAIDSNTGKVYLGGVTAGNFAAARYTAAGALDTTFNSSGATPGTVTTAFNPSGLDAANGLAIQYNGKVVLTGYTTSGGGQTQLALERLTTDGSLDSHFGTGGKVVTAISTNNATSNGIVVDGTKAVVVGTVDSGTNAVAPDDFLLAKYQLNNAPTLGNTNASLTDIVESEQNNPGTLVSVLNNGSHLNAGDVDGDTDGLAVTGFTDPSGNGTWQYSLDNGTTWTDIPVSVGVHSALLLSPTDRVRFSPPIGYNTGSPTVLSAEPTLSVVAWDQTVGTHGDTNADTQPAVDPQFAQFGNTTSTLYQAITPAQTTVYVNSTWAGTNQGDTVTDGFGSHTFGIDAFATVSDGTTFVAANGTVHVDAGTYVEVVVISKALSLLGPNANINPNTGTPVAPAIVEPDQSHPDPNDNQSSTILYIAHDNVTIKGLTVDGDNPNLNTGVSQNGANVDAIEGISSYEGVSNVDVENNVLQNFSYAGFDFYNYFNSGAATGNNTISNNKLDNIGYAPYGFGIGALLYNNFYANVTDNVMTRVRLGVQTGNFNLADPGSLHSISNNTISATRSGIFDNLFYQNASTFTIAGNTITAGNDPSATRWDGVEVASFQSGVSVSLQNNTIQAGGVTQPTAGYELWNDPTSGAIDISGGSVTGATYGVFANNYDGYSSPASGPTSAILDGVTISNSTAAGVYVKDNPSDTGHHSVSIAITNGTSISGGPTGVLVQGAAASVSMTGSSISGVTTGVSVSGGSATIGGATAAGSNSIAASGTGILVSSGSATIQNNSTTIDNATIGIDVEGGTASITGNHFVGNGTDVKIGASGAVSALTNNAFTGTQFINNQSSAAIDATTDSYNVGGGGAQVGGNSLTLSQAYAVEDRITDVIDQSGLGLVRIQSGNVFVTQLSENTNLGAIQRGINAATAGDNVHVQAGTFKENLTLNKSVQLLGNNAGTAGAGSRAAETVVMTNGNQSAVVTVTASNVTIDGLTITGDDTSVVGQSVYSGADANAFYAITNGNTTTGALINNLTVSNDILQRTAIGFLGNLSSGVATGNSINNNLFQDIGVYDFGYAVSLRNNFYANVTNNVMRRVYTGLHINNFSAADTGGFSLTGNDIQAYANGLWANQAYSSAPTMLVDNNTFSTATTNYQNNALAPVANNIGVLFTGGPGYVGTTFTHNTITNQDYGVVVWDTPTGVTLGSTNSISGGKVGVYVTNNVGFNPIGSTSLGLVTGTPNVATLDGISISTTGANSVGVWVRGDSGGASSTATLQNSVSISGGVTGLKVDGSQAHVGGGTLNNTAFSGQSDQYIRLANAALAGTIVDGTTATFDGLTGAGATLAQNYDIEDKIFHATDDGTLGFIRVKANQVYVTPNSGSIQRGINAALAGDTVNVKAGTYHENVNLNKQVQVVGAGSGNTASDTVIDAGGSTNGITISASGASAAPADRVLIQHLRVTNGGGTGDVTTNSTVSHITLDDVALVGSATNGLEVHNAGVVSDLVLSNDTMSGNTIGFRISTQGKVSGLSISNSHFDNNTDGLYNETDGTVGQQASFTDVTVTNSTFSNDSNKGIYVEKLNNAVFTNVTVDHSGTSGANSAGIDINLKRGVYSHIVFNDLTMTNSGTGDASVGVGLAVKARGSSAADSSYSGNPATVSDVEILGGTFTGNQNGIRIGEPGKANLGPTGVVIDQDTSNVSPVISNNVAVGVLLVGGKTTVQNSTINNNGVAGIVIDTGTARIQNNDLTGNNEGVIVKNDALVDLGDATASNTTGLGSSAGHNVLTGYTPTGGHYAIDDQNLVASANRNVKAQLNNFGPYTNINIIGTVIHDHADDPTLTVVDYSQALNQQPQPNVVYVKSSWAGSTLGSDPDGAGPGTAFGVDEFATIQDGVNGVASGGEVVVESGTYTENVDVNKPVSIDGAGQANVTVYSTASNPTGGSLGSPVFLVDADNVTIDNLTVDGDNPGNGAGIDASTGIITNWDLPVTLTGINVNHVTVQNVYERGIEFANGNDNGTGTFHIDNNTVTNVQGDPSNSIAIFNYGGHGTISGNNVSFTPDAISTNHSFGTTISGNVVTHANAGIHSDNNGDGAGALADSISDNNVSLGSGTGSNGIFVFVPYVTVSVSNNIVSGVDTGLAAYGGSGGTAAFSGNTVSVNSGGAGALVTTDTLGFGQSDVNATFNGDSFTGGDTGILVLQNAPATASASISNVTINDPTIGINVNGGSATITGSHIFHNNIGIRLINGGSAGITNNNFAGATPNVTDLDIESTAGLVTGGGSLSGNHFAASQDYITLNTAQNLDATAATFSGIDPSSGATTLAQDYGIEDKIADGIDTDGDGLVRIKNGNVYVAQSSETPGTGGSPDSLQRAVDLSSGGDAVHVQAGTFAGPVSVDKSLSLQGANFGVSGSGSRGSETVVTPAASGSDLDDSIFAVTASNVSIDGFTIDGHNVSRATGTQMVGGVASGAYTGITNYDSVTTNDYVAVNNLHVQNNIIQNILAIGVELDSGTGQSSTGAVIDSNKLSNISDPTFGLGIFLGDNAFGAVTSNVLNGVTDGITINHYGDVASTHALSVSGNQIQSHGNGVYLLDAYVGHGSVAISNNSVTTVAGSTVNRGIALEGIDTGASVTVSGNSADGAHAGVFLWGNTGNVTVTGGSLTNNDYGVLASTHDDRTDSDFTGTSGGVTLDSMNIGSSGQDGISVDSVASLAVTNDNIGSSGQDGVHVTNTPSVTISGDDIADSGQNGVSIGAGTTASISNNVGSIHGNAVGILVSTGSASISGNHIYNNGVGVEVTGTGHASLTGNDFTGATDNGTDLKIVSTLANPVTGLTNNSFAGDTFFIDDQSPQNLDMTPGTGNTMDESNNFRIEDKMHHRVDTDLPLSNGLITWVADNIYVTAPGTHSTGSSDTDSSIQHGIDATPVAANRVVNVEEGSYSEDVTIDKSITLLGAQHGNDAATRAPGHESILTSADGLQAFAIQADDVTIDGFTVQGVTGGHDPGNLNTGIWTNGNTGIAIQNNILTDNPSGIAIGSSSGTISHNLFDSNNVAGPGQGTGIEFFAGGTDWTIDSNTFVGQTSESIAIVDSSHITISNDQMSDAGVFMLGSDHIAITESTISGAVGNGIEIGGGNSDITVYRDTITGTTAPLGSVGAAIAIDNPFGNAYNVDPNSGDITITQNFLGRTSDSDTNAAHNNVYGVFIADSTNGDALANGANVQINSNSIYHNTTAGVENDSTVSVDATGNWWGDADGPNSSLNTFHPNNPAGDKIVGDATFVPWLTDGTDLSHATPGFQPTATDTQPPVITSPGTTASGTEGALVTLHGDWTDADGSFNDEYTTLWHLVSTTTGQVIADQHTTDLNFTPVEEGTYVWSFTVTDHAGNSDTQTTTITVADADVDATGNFHLTPTEGADSGMQTVATFTDPGGAEALTDYSAMIDWGDGSAPSAGTISFAGGVFTVKGNHTYAEESAVEHSNSSPYDITVTINHDTSNPQTVHSSATVSDPSVSGTGGFAVTATEGADSGTQTVATFTDPGGAEALGDYSAMISWGDGSAPSAGSISFAGGVFTVKGSHTYAEESAADHTGSNPYDITVTLSHESAPNSVVHSSAVVSDPDVVAAGGFHVTSAEGADSGAQTVATFTDPGGAEALGDYAAMIDWGDGSAPSAGVISFAGGVFTVKGSHTYGEESAADHTGSNPYDVTVTISHEASAPQVVYSDATVSDPSVDGTGGFTVTATEGVDSGSQTVATFTDPGGAEALGDYSALINWGDGSAPTAGVISFAGGVFTVKGSHTYTEESAAEHTGSNPYDITVTLSHESAPNSVVHSSATVADPAVSGTGGFTVTAVEGADSGSQTVATFTDPGGAEALGDYSAMINWGDGTAASVGAISFSGGVFTVKGHHTYAEESSAEHAGSNPYSITVTISHESAPQTIVNSSATVSDPGVIATGGFTVTATEGNTSTSQTVAIFTDPGGAESLSDYSASIDWGDGHQSAGVISYDSGTQTFTVKGTHLYAEEGGYTIHTTISHDSNPTLDVTTASAATVTDAALSLTLAPPSPSEGIALTNVIVGSFTDAAGASADINDFTATIHWGDGAVTTASAALGTIVSNGGGGYNILGTHTYADEFTHITFQVDIHDAGGASDSKSAFINVADTPPTADLSGNVTITNEGALYTLHIGATTDPGPNHITGYAINWGDGNIDSFASGGDPANSNHAHTYTDGPSLHHISVTLIDEDGPHGNAGTLDVTVNNVNPTASLQNFFPNINEGDAGFIQFTNQHDDSSVDTSAGFHYAYDFNNDGHFDSGDGSYGGSGTSDGITVPASFLIIPGSHTVRARIIDKDGGFEDITTTITSANVAPSVNLPATLTAAAGSLFTFSGSFSDPGTSDGPWTGTVNYGDGTGDQVLSINSVNHTYQLSHTYTTAGGYTLVVKISDHPVSPDGIQPPAASLTGQASSSVTVNATTFQVTSFTPTASGFDVTFNRAVDLTELNLYGSSFGGLGASDLSIVGTNTGPVHGSIIWDPSTNTAHFVRTGGPLPADTYSVTLLSRADGWVDTGGHQLDGDSNNSDGGNYTTTFGVSFPITPRVLSLPDIARGPGQLVNIPNSGVGVPITLSDGSSVLAVDFDLVYNTSLLNITAANLASGLPAGWTLTMNFISPGRIKFTASGTTALASGSLTLMNLTASVPQTAAYAGAADLQIQNLRVNEGNIASLGDSAVEKVAYFGDTSGNGFYTGLDAGLISRVVVLLDTGFDAYPLTDPLIVADITADNTLSGLDASLVAQKASGFSVSQIPNIPTGFSLVGGGIDPTFSGSTHTLGVRGGIADYTVLLDQISGITDIGFTFTVSYTSGILHLSSGDISLGDALPAGWSIVANVDDTNGTATLSFFNGGTNSSSDTTKPIVNMNFHVPANDNPSVTPVDLTGPATDGTPGHIVSYTYVDGSIDIAPWFTGTSGNDQYTVRLNGAGDTVQVWENQPTTGAPTYSFAASLLALPNFNVFKFTTLGGDDTLTVDYSNGNPLPAGGVNFDGGANATAAGDTLVLKLPSSSANNLTVNGSGVTFGSTPFALTNDELVIINGGSNDDTVTQAATPAVPYVFNGGTGNDTLNIFSGSRTFDSDASLTTANLTVNVDGASSSVVFNSSQTLAGLHLTHGGTAVVSSVLVPYTPWILNINSLSFADSGSSLDLTNNELVVNQPIGDVRGEIGAGQIFTSTPVSGEALGYFNAGGPTKVRLTLLGDCDLDGIVNVADLADLSGNFGTVSGAIWQEGDFDYNGTVNVADLADLSGNFGHSLPGGPSAPVGVATSSASAATTTTGAASPAAIPAATTTAAVASAVAPTVTASPAAEPAALTSNDKDTLSITTTAPRTSSSSTNSGTHSVKIEKTGKPSHHRSGGGGKHKGNPLDGLGQL